MNENIKSKIKSKNLFYKQHTQNGRKESDLTVLGNLITELNELISSILKPFYNDKKIPLTPPLLIDKKFVTDIRTKFFAEQYTPLKNSNVLFIKPGVFNSRMVMLT